MSATGRKNAMVDFIDLRAGDHREVLQDAECDALITDPPYSPKTHEGQRSDVTEPSAIDYNAITEHQCNEFAFEWYDRVQRWVVIFGDHITYDWHRNAWEGMGWYVFAPVVWVKRDAAPRFQGDGPATSCEHIMIARPRRKLEKPDQGSRPGHYIVTAGRSGVVGSKSLDGMRAIVRDYSRPGDLICDPFAGSATTLIAAAEIRRMAIGSEVDPKTYELARLRIARGYTVELPTAEPVIFNQTDLGFGEG